METRLKNNNRTYLYRALCVLAAATALFPLSCDYIMSGGIITEWIARIEEIASGFRTGHIYLFPQAETFLITGIGENGMDSNLWFMIPGILYGLSGNMVLAYRIFVTVIQAGTLFACILLFGRLFAGTETKLPVFFGCLLYMTCPYRIYICYDKADLSQAAACMLLPLYIWSAAGIARKQSKIRDVIIAGLILAGVGYADAMFFVIAGGITLLAGLILRKLGMIASAAAGSVLFLPGLYRLGRYLLLDHFRELDMPLGTIMQYGYRPGEYFTSYSFREGHPGMGMGMFICLLTGLWLGFVKNKEQKTGLKKSRKEYRFFLILSFLLTILSFYRFPWDLFQRMGGWSLKLVSLIGTPAVFWGMAFLCLCIPAAYFMEWMSRNDNKEAAFAVPLTVMVTSIGICLFQCNTLICNRLPV